jgi:DNA-binding GntR family transcriptional regulator
MLHLFRARSLMQGGGLSISNDEHRDMVDAIASGDAERAHKKHFDHVMAARARLVTTQDSNPSSQAKTKKVAP